MCLRKVREEWSPVETEYVFIEIDVDKVMSDTALMKFEEELESLHTNKALREDLKLGQMACSPKI